MLFVTDWPLTMVVTFSLASPSSKTVTIPKVPVMLSATGTTVMLLVMSDEATLYCPLNN